MKLSAFISIATFIGGSSLTPFAAKAYSCSPYTAAAILERMVIEDGHDLDDLEALENEIQILGIN